MKTLINISFWSSSTTSLRGEGRQRETNQNSNLHVETIPTKAVATHATAAPVHMTLGGANANTSPSAMNHKVGNELGLNLFRESELGLELSRENTCVARGPWD